MPDTFVDTLTATMPKRVELDPKLVETFDWMEAQGWTQTFEHNGSRHVYLPIYPPDQHQLPNASQVTFGGTNRKYTAHWSMPNPDVDARIIEIATTSGDGGRAAIWVDEAGAQWYVHLGHDTVGVISDDPAVLLQFLAMGYPEPGALEATNITPLQQALDFIGARTEAELDQEDGVPLAPVALQRYLTEEFGITKAATARDLGIADFVIYGTQDTADPFVRWLNKVTPPPTPEELAYIQELSDLAESIDVGELKLDDPKRPDGILDKILGLFRPNKN